MQEQTAINAVYFPSWRVYRGRPPSSLDVDKITHIFYAFVGVNEDGTLRRVDEFADDEKEVDGVRGCLTALAKLKLENPHLRTLISVGGGASSEEFPKMAGREQSRLVFAAELKNFVDDYGFDGADIDWEHPNDALSGANYTKLLRDVRQALPKSQYLLTTALPVGIYCLKHINVPAVTEHLDFINLMGYDFSGDWTDVSGHHAQLVARDETIQKSCAGGIMALSGKGFPRNKIILGIPVYARYFSGATRPGQPFQKSGDIEYSALPDHWVQNASIDAPLAAASFIDTGGDKGFVSFDVPQTVKIKVQYAKAIGLGGMFYWHGSGDRTGNESLVAAGWNEWRKYDLAVEYGH